MEHRINLNPHIKPHETRPECIKTLVIKNFELRLYTNRIHIHIIYFQIHKLFDLKLNKIVSFIK